jgi:transcriptional regulator with XRE-family HTH domain
LCFRSFQAQLQLGGQITLGDLVNRIYGKLSIKRGEGGPRGGTLGGETVRRIITKSAVRLVSAENGPDGGVEVDDCVDPLFCNRVDRCDLPTISRKFLPRWEHTLHLRSRIILSKRAVGWLNGYADHVNTTRLETNSEVSALGFEIHTERARQGLSVSTLSKRSGVSFGLISQLERGLGNPSFRSLHKLAEALGIPLSRLVAGGHMRDEAVVRVDERLMLPVPVDEPAHQRVVRELLTPGLHSSLQVIRSTVPAGFSNEGQAFRHLGTECIIIESGSLTVVHGSRRVELAVGDAMTYTCSVPHWWANTSDEACTVIGAVTPFEQ